MSRTRRRTALPTNLIDMTGIAASRPARRLGRDRTGSGQAGEGRGMRTEVIDTPELGDRSYLVHDGETGLVIDPQRDTGRITALAGRLGVRIGLVAETHIHNDYVTGGYQLARECAAPYAVQADEQVGFGRLGVRDGDELPVGSLSVQVIATPGHTPGHLAYAVSRPDRPAAVFTGGSLLYGSVGRTDLIDPALTRNLALAQVR